MQIGNLLIDAVVDPLFGENTYFLRLPEAGECLVVDPGLTPDEQIEKLHSLRLAPAAILNTHGHSDHIAGNEALKRLWPDCPLMIGRGDEPKLSDPQLNLSAPFGLALTSPPADRLLDEGDTVEAAGFVLKVLDAPGHSVGHIVFLLEDNTPQVVIGGDVLFQGSIGRTDFPDGDFEQLRDAIWNKLFTLPDDTVVLPGHGEPTTIGAEKSENPFVGVPAGYKA